MRVYQFRHAHVQGWKKPPPAPECNALLNFQADRRRSGCFAALSRLQTTKNQQAFLMRKPVALLLVLLALAAGVFLYLQSDRSPGTTGSGGSSGAATRVPWAHESSEIPPDPEVRYGALANGMRYAIRPHAEPPGRIAVRLHVDAGSLMEEDDQRGVAHFL